MSCASLKDGPVHKSGFFDLTMEVSQLSNCDLSNEIHRVFRLEQFPEPKPFCHDALRTSLQLATHLLRKALPMFYTLLCLKPRDLGKLSSLGHPLYEFPEPPLKLNIEQEQITWHALDCLADNVNYGLIETHDVWGIATWLFDEMPSRGVPGRPSHISLQAHLYRQLEKAWKTRHRDPLLLQYLLWRHADTLLHELFHAAHTLVVPRDAQRAEIFMGPSAKTTEEGCELQVWLYGGVMPMYTKGGNGYAVDGQKSACEYSLCALEWPSPCFADSYGKEVTVRGEISDADVRWTIPFEWLSRLFTDEFWRNEAVFPGGLKMPREHGYRYVLTRPQCYTTPYPTTYEDDFNAYLPEGFISTDHGLVIKKPAAKNMSVTGSAAMREVDSGKGVPSEVLNAALRAQAKRRKTKNTTQVWQYCFYN